MTLERNDLGGSPNDACLIAMRQAVAPWGEARSDFAIFAELAAASTSRALHRRAATRWLLRHLYAAGAGRVADHGARRFVRRLLGRRFLDVPGVDDDLVLFKQSAPTRSGRPSAPERPVEIFSATIDGFGYDDCPGTRRGSSPPSGSARRWPGVTRSISSRNNPTARLHSQLDVGAFSQSTKCAAASRSASIPSTRARAIRRRRRVRVFNDRGSCLAGAVVTDHGTPRVVQLSTRACTTRSTRPIRRDVCPRQPNVLNVRSRHLEARPGCSGQHALVEVERWTGPLPPIRAYDPPPMERRDH